MLSRPTPALPRRRRKIRTTFPSSGWAEIDWDAILTLRDRLPQPIQVFYDGVKIQFHDFPAIEDLLENYPPLSPFTDALYRGQPPKDGDPWVQKPEVVSLFRGNLSRPSTDPEDIRSEPLRPSCTKPCTGSVSPRCPASRPTPTRWLPAACC